MFTNDEVKSALNRIQSFIIKSPCIYSSVLSQITGAELFLKLENLQSTGSFKERGALSFLSCHDFSKRKTVIAASAGNHAQAVARHAPRFGVLARIIMPKLTSNIKVMQTKNYGAEVILEGDDYDQAFQAALEMSHDLNAPYIHAYNDRDVIIGQATIAHEILEQIGLPDYIYVPLGGGGLISGIAQYMHNAALPTKIVGIEAKSIESMALALRKGSPQKIRSGGSIAEGIAVRRVGELTYEICARLKPFLLSVDDSEIEKAIMFLLERQKIVVEGAGAAALAGLLSEPTKAELKGKRVVLIISGGNIDLSLLSRLSTKALIDSKRLSRLSLTISDNPGSLAALLNHITRLQGNIIDIEHERHFAQLKWNEVHVNLIVETKDAQHETSMLSALRAEGFDVRNYSKESAFGGSGGTIRE